MSGKISLFNLLGRLNIQHKMPKILRRVAEARQVYVRVPAPYPGDVIIYEFYVNGLSTGDTFDDVDKSCVSLLSMDPVSMHGFICMGLHHHRCQTDVNDGEPGCKTCGGIGYAPTARSMDAERCHCNP